MQRDEVRLREQLLKVHRLGAAPGDLLRREERIGRDHVHELANRPTSETIYGLSWGPILADAAHAGRTLATGYSCRCQAKLVDGLQLMHPLQLLLRAVKAGSAAHYPHAGISSSLEREHHEEY